MLDSEFITAAQELHGHIDAATNLTRSLFDTPQAEENDLLLLLVDVSYWLCKVHPCTTELAWFSQKVCRPPIPQEVRLDPQG